MTCIAVRVARSGHVSQFAIPSTIANPANAAAFDLCFILPLTDFTNTAVCALPAAQGLAIAQRFAWL